MVSATAGTILIVEDDTGVAMLQRRALERAGYGVLTAATADEAFSVVAQHEVHLAVLDYSLPGGVTGLQVYDRLKAAGRNFPVVLVTGFGNEELIIQALRQGVCDFVSKSVEYLDYLPRAVQRVLKQSRLVDVLRKSEERFQLLARATNDAVWDWNLRTQEVWWNDNFAAAFGYRSDAMESHIRWWESRIHSDDAQRVISGLRKVIDGDGQFWSEEYRLLRGDGSTAYVFHRGNVIRDWSGKPTRMVASLIDITARREAEQALRESEARFQAFMDNSPAIAFIKDAQGRMLYANSALERCFGWRREDWFGKTEAEFLPPDVAQRLHENDLKVLAQGKALQFEEEVPSPDGGSRYWMVYKFPMHDACGNLLLGGTAINITERKQAQAALADKEQQFRQAQKLEAVGELAGGVAHEFNNLLQAIFAFTGFALEALPPDHAASDDLRQVLAAAERAAMLTRQLLGFGRRQVLQRTGLNPNETVADFLKMLRPLIGADIELRTDLAQHVGTIHADPGLLQQMLLNLCVNARDAMPHGGQLTITTRNVTRECCEQHDGIAQGDYVVLTVADNGCGMTPDVKARLFEPFFTTKEVGKGTGLGLSMVYGVVRQHGGTIHVYSELGLGTTVRIYLPAISTSPQTSALEPPMVVAGGTETILVADDDDSVRKITARVLQRAGYKVILATDGADAVHRFQEASHEISLAVLDVVMPKIGGDEAYWQMAATKPGLPVIFCSGYDPDMERTEFVMKEGHALLQKPFDPQALLRLVRETLDAKFRRACCS